jgi:hypothetical protein
MPKVNLLAAQRFVRKHPPQLQRQSLAELGKRPILNASVTRDLGPGRPQSSIQRHSRSIAGAPDAI